MTCNIRTLFRYAAFSTAAAISLAGIGAKADPFTVTYLGPGVQSPVGITSYYETFDAVTVSGGTFSTNFQGSNITGTYSGTFHIYGQDAYGGAGGSGSYLAQQVGESTTLDLSQGVNYFGLWFSALDGGNNLQFYNGTTLVYSFTPADFISGVGSCPSSTGYCGNPNNGSDASEQFAYINFYDTTSTFNKVIFSQGPGGNFESDNNAIANVSGLTTGTVLGATPEPSSLVLLGTGALGMASMLRRRMLGSR